MSLHEYRSFSRFNFDSSVAFATAVTVLVSKSLVDALGGVALLLRRGLILLQDLIDYALERVELRSTRR